MKQFKNPVLTRLWREGYIDGKTGRRSANALVRAHQGHTAAEAYRCGYVEGTLRKAKDERNK